MTFKAQIIADSKNEFGNRLTTFVITFPRIILAEKNTHRMWSRNSASSRAIPFKKMVQSVKDNPFIPLKWMKDHSGMQGVEYWENENDIKIRTDAWLAARDSAVTHAEILNESLGVSKQVANRLLELFMYHTAIVTASEFENFFALRAHKDAEIHMQHLAYLMLDEYNKSEPRALKAGEWHIPMGDQIDLPPTIPIDPGYTLDEGVAIRKVKIATARCARVSYTVVGEEEKKHDYDADIKLHDRLLASGHLSPFEHCAQAMNEDQHYFRRWSGNFKGFIQYRKTIDGENKTDERVKK